MPIMSTTRLAFLYPQLLRAARVGDVAAKTTRTVPRRCLSDTARRGTSNGGAPFGASAARRQIARRHGKAVEPLPSVDEGAMPKPPPAAETSAAEEAQNVTEPAPTEASEQAAPVQDTVPDVILAEAPSPEAATPTGEAEDQNKSAPPDDTRTEAKKGGPLEAILHMGSPPGQEPPGNGKGKMQHLTPPPYVHHFDAYSLVKQLEAGGYTPDQAERSMKVIRKVLAQNLDVAQESLVSKSDVENETYLFRAACSELSTEVKNNRRIADEEMRQKRTHLQHEVDILTQSMNQEVLTLNDNVRGMFNDRKIAVREEQKAVESTIQQINYKISISLSSDAKSEIEGLRWVLIRRSVIGILFMAVFTLGTLRYGTYVSHENKKEAERLEKQAQMLRAADGKKDHSSGPDAAQILAAN